MRSIVRENYQWLISYGNANKEVAHREFAFCIAVTHPLLRSLDSTVSMSLVPVLRVLILHRCFLFTKVS